MNNIKIAIIGIGNIGWAHAECIANNEIPNMLLSAVCDIKSDRLEDFCNKYPDITAFEDYNELLHSKICDSVIIAVPHPLHAEIAIKALECGLNVLLEKPADISVSKVEALNEAARKSDKVFSMMFNQRTNPIFNKAREIVQSGQLGELKRTIWIVTNWYRTQSYYDSGDWRATWSGEGGGVLLNQCPHNLDLWQWICGMPKSISAYCDIGKYHNIEVEDDVTILTRYENGAIGTFITSTGEYPGTNRLEISGTLGKIVLENGILKWWKLSTDERKVSKNSEKSFSHIDFDYTEYIPEKTESGHKLIIKNFANAILNGEKLIAPGIDGIYELTISNAAYLSSWNNNKEITLPFDTAEFDKILKEKAESSIHKQINKTDSSSYGYEERWKVNW